MFSPVTWWSQLVAIVAAAVGIGLKRSHWLKVGTKLFIKLLSINVPDLIRQTWWCVCGSQGRSLALQRMVSWVARPVSWDARTVSVAAGQSHGLVSSLSLIARTVSWVAMTVPSEVSSVAFSKTLYHIWATVSLRSL